MSNLHNRSRARWSRGILLLGALVLAGAGPGEAAPRLDGPLIGGGRLDPRALAGQVVVVDFWASWCEPCRRSFPSLDAMGRRLRARGLVVVGVSVDEELATARRFVDELHPSFANVHDGDHALAERWSPPALPSTFVIGRDGRIRAVLSGGSDREPGAIEAHVLAALGGSR